VTADPVAAVSRFIDCINVRDVDGLSKLMTDDHELIVFDEPPLRGRTANVEAWRGYASSYPSYVISPHRIAERDGVVAVLGHTTGSHLGLPDDEEQELTLIWLAEVADGHLRSWRLVEDSPARRKALGL
jgi:ketosteroid isomerase-like protein